MKHEVLLRYKNLLVHLIYKINHDHCRNLMFGETVQEWNTRRILAHAVVELV